MNAILIKIFATALAFSQVSTKPDEVKTRFDPAADREVVSQILRDGCAQMRKAFDIEDINLDDLIATAMDDPKVLAGDIKAFRGVDFNDLHLAYRQFCKNEQVANSPVDLGEVIAFYNKAVVDLPDDAKLKSLGLAGAYTVMDGKGNRYAEVFEPEHRRIWVPVASVPEYVRNAFVTAEDKRFFQHKGVDERGLIRAFITNIAQPGRPQGGSTITQQVAKNLLVGDDVTYERKIREMLVASRLESLLSKDAILELYLNSIYLGRGSWGIEMAARSYFGKPAKDLTLTEGAMLAGLTKGPSYFNPERHPDRANERLAYVLSRMQAEGVVSEDDARSALAAAPTLVAYERLRRDSGFYVLDQLAREAKGAGFDHLTVGSYTINSTVRPEIQKVAETALQDGLARYEMSTGRARFLAPEANLADSVRKLDADTQSDRPGWQRALAAARLPLYDVHWTPAIVLGTGAGKGKNNDGGLRVGLTDGRVMPLSVAIPTARKKLAQHDVVYVRVVEPKGKSAARAELRARPYVQGAVVVLDNASGAILAVAGGFSYPLSQLNRATQAQRQPGSTLKPLTFLAALRRGLQPNTILRDMPITLPPIGSGPNIIAYPGSDKDYWSPKNYSGGGSGVITLRRALEHSKNLVTANLLDGGIEDSPEASLDRVCELAQEARIYKDCMRFYPFVLGAQPARLIDLAAFYAAVASEGARPAPHVIESIVQNGSTVYRSKAESTWLGSADRVAFFQLKQILQGVVERGTAAVLRPHAGYLAGKTGTSDDENDAWFVGFSNDVTVAVWVGYDNADGKRRTLGPGQTGARVAIPIFEPVMQAVWANYAPKTPLAGPSAVARRQLVPVPIEYYSGAVLPQRSQSAFTEYMRTDATGRVTETQYALVTRDESHAIRNYQAGLDGDAMYDHQQNGIGGLPQFLFGQGTMFPQQQQQQPRRGPIEGLFGGLFGGGAAEQRALDQREEQRRRQRRVDPDYLLGRRQYN